MSVPVSFYTQEESTNTTKENCSFDIQEAAAEIGIKYPVKVSPELSAILMPNDFMSSLGIQYSHRLKAILKILKCNLHPENNGATETLPKLGVAIPFTITNGPFIREEVLNLRAHLTNNGGQSEIVLTVILDD